MRAGRVYSVIASFLSRLLLRNRCRQARRSVLTILSFLVLSVLALLTGCAAEPVEEPRYYLLSSHPKAVDKSDVKFVVGIREVTAATYINNSGIAVKTGDNQIRLASYHLWAEQPDQAITRVLFSELNYRLSAFRVENSFSYLGSDWHYSINTQVDQFHGTEQGEAILTGYWQLLDKNGVLNSYRFNFTTRLEQPGYEALVSALRQLLSQLAEQQAARLQAL